MAKTNSIKDYFLSIVQKVRGGDQKILINNVTVRPIQRQTQDIQKWRTAIQQAEGYAQQRAQLFELFEDLLLDGYLRSVIRKRIDQVTNRELQFVKSDGTIVDTVTDLVHKTYFEKLLTEVMQAKFWGHSLVELLWPAPGDEATGDTILIPRRHVKPRWGIVTENAYDTQGVEYRKKPFVDNIIEVGEPEDLGLLMAAAQYVIYKRGNFGDWAEFAEIFGIPFRWASYNNEQSRQVLEQALENAGPAGYVVAPTDADLKFLSGNTTGNGSDVFRFLRQACNEEIAYTILGNTMTTMEARSSGYAQSETHQEGEIDLNASDRRYLLRILNEKLVPYLARLGYDVSDGHWRFNEEERLSLAQRIDVDLKVATQVPIGESYWYERYGIPRPDPSEIREEEEEETGGPGDGGAGDGETGRRGDEEMDDDEEDDDMPTQLSAKGKTGKKKGVSKAQRIRDYYHLHAGGSCPHCSGSMQLAEQPRADFTKIPGNLERQVADNVYQGLTQINPELHRQYYSRMRKFARVGFSRSLSESIDWDDFELQQGIKRNISAFAAVKQQALIEELLTAARKPRAEYDRISRAIIKRYHTVYLESELLTLEAAASMADAWRGFLDRADLYPNLQFSTVGDDRVRPAHAALDGAVYPVGDPFWNTHTPPLDWRCRCTLIQTDAGTEERPTQPVRAGFGKNPYRTRALIHDSHPYFQLPADQLAGLLELAETLRAGIERPDVIRRAGAYTGAAMEEGGQAYRLTNSGARQVMDQESKQEALRNALLTVLPDVLRRMNAAGSEADTARRMFRVEVLGKIFHLFFTSEGDTLLLDEIRML